MRTGWDWTAADWPASQWRRRLRGHQWAIAVRWLSTSQLHGWSRPARPGGEGHSRSLTDIGDALGHFTAPLARCLLLPSAQLKAILFNGPRYASGRRRAICGNNRRESGDVTTQSYVSGVELQRQTRRPCRMDTAVRASRGVVLFVSTAALWLIVNSSLIDFTASYITLHALRHRQYCMFLSAAYSRKNTSSTVWLSIDTVSQKYAHLFISGINLSKITDFNDFWCEILNKMTPKGYKLAHITCSHFTLGNPKK